MRANFTIIWLLVGLAIFVRADKTSSGKLTGAVRDSEGAVIANSVKDPAPLMPSPEPKRQY